MTEAYPLHWPEGRKRTSWRDRARFKTTFGAAVQFVVSELQRLDAVNPVISTNVPLRNDGLPYAKYSNIIDVGVAVYFLYKKRQVCMACDRWDKVEDNLQAIGKSIEAMRGIERWGSGDMLEAAFTGFVALPPSKKPFREVLGLTINSPLSHAEECYRALAKKYHPDVPGGSTAKMSELNVAIDEARKELK